MSFSLALFAVLITITWMTIYDVEFINKHRKNAYKALDDNCMKGDWAKILHSYIYYTNPEQINTSLYCWLGILLGFLTLEFILLFVFSSRLSNNFDFYRRFYNEEEEKRSEA